jgi:hypothetical protein
MPLKGGLERVTYTVISQTQGSKDFLHLSVKGKAGTVSRTQVG